MTRFISLGIYLSAMLVVIGEVLYLWLGSNMPLNIIQLGLGLLVCLPTLRVILTGWHFLKLGDYVFVGLCLFILGLIVYSWIGGH